MNQNDQLRGQNFHIHQISEGIPGIGYVQSFASDEDEVNKYSELNKENQLLFEDSRITKLYFERHRLIEQVRFQLLIVSTFIFLMDVSKMYKFQYDDNFFQQEEETNIFEWLLLGLTFILILLTLISYISKLNYSKETLLIPQGISFYRSHYFLPFVFESIIILLIPSFLTEDIKIYFTINNNPKQYFYFLNEILSLFLLLRGILIINIILRLSEFYDSKINRLCSLYAVDLNIPFMLKLWIKEQPIKFVLLLFSFGLIYFSIGIWIAERPLIRENDGGSIVLLQNSFYDIFFTLIVFSYGDYQPETYIGRSILTLCIFYGFTLVSIFISSITQYLQFSQSEAYANVLLDRIIKREEMEVTLCAIGEQYYYLTKYDVNPFTYNRVVITKDLLKKIQKQKRHQENQNADSLEILLKNKEYLARQLFSDFNEQIQTIKRQQELIYEAVEFRRQMMFYKYIQNV